MMQIFRLLPEESKNHLHQVVAKHLHSKAATIRVYFTFQGWLHFLKYLAAERVMKDQP